MVNKNKFKNRAYKMGFIYEDQEFNGLTVYEKYVELKNHSHYFEFTSSKYKELKEFDKEYNIYYTYVECTKNKKGNEGDIEAWLNNGIYNLPTEQIRVTMRCDGVKDDPENEDEFIVLHTNKHGKVYWEDYNGDASFIVDCYAKYNKYTEDVAINTILVPKAHIDEIDDEVLKQHYEISKAKAKQIK